MIKKYRLYSPLLLSPGLSARLLRPILRMHLLMLAAPVAGESPRPDWPRVEEGVGLVAVEGTLLGGHVAHLVLLELKGSAEAELALVAGVSLLVLWEVAHQLVCVEVVSRVEGLGAGRAAEARGVQVEEDVLVQFVAAQVLDVATHHVALA